MGSQKQKNKFVKNNPVPAIEKTYKSIKTILEKARSKSFKAVNSLMVQAYWHIGRIIAEVWGRRNVA